MAFQVMTKNFEAPPVNPSEIFRYAFCGKNPAEDVRILAMASVEEALLGQDADNPRRRGFGPRIWQNQI